MVDRDIKLVVYGIIISAYMAMFYEIFKDLAKTPIDVSDIITSGLAGIGSLGVGFGVFFFLIYKKRL